jgi:hypothetical protein
MPSQRSVCRRSSKHRPPSTTPLPTNSFARVSRFQVLFEDSEPHTVAPELEKQRELPRLRGLTAQELEALQKVCKLDEDRRLLSLLHAADPVAMYSCLQHLTVSCTVNEAQQALSQVVPGFDLGRALRVFCDVGWGSNDGQRQHFVERLERSGRGVIGPLELLSEIGMWVYSDTE